MSVIWKIKNVHTTLNTTVFIILYILKKSFFSIVKIKIANNEFDF